MILMLSLLEQLDDFFFELKLLEYSVKHDWLDGSLMVVGMTQKRLLLGVMYLQAVCAPNELV